MDTSRLSLWVGLLVMAIFNSPGPMFLPQGLSRRMATLPPRSRTTLLQCFNPVAVAQAQSVDSKSYSFLSHCQPFAFRSTQGPLLCSSLGRTHLVLFARQHSISPSEQLKSLFLSFSSYSSGILAGLLGILAHSYNR